MFFRLVYRIFSSDLEFIKEDPDETNSPPITDFV